MWVWCDDLISSWVLPGKVSSTGDGVVCCSSKRDSPLDIQPPTRWRSNVQHHCMRLCCFQVPLWWFHNKHHYLWLSVQELLVIITSSGKNCTMTWLVMPLPSFGFNCVCWSQIGMRIGEAERNSLLKAHRVLATSTAVWKVKCIQLLKANHINPTHFLVCIPLHSNLCGINTVPLQIDKLLYKFDTTTIPPHDGVLPNLTIKTHF